MSPWNLLFPFNKNAGEMLGKLNLNDMEPYIEKFFSQFIPQTQKFFSEQPTNPAFSFMSPAPGTSMIGNNKGLAVFETHEHVFIRIQVKDADQLKEIKIFHTSNQVFLEGLPGKKEREVITLPAIVKKKGAHAVYKEGILEIRIQKSQDLQFSQIDVSEG
ncbi:HSP20 family molecular chaperone IbpA [Peribacillus deserti]|uniref:HSP20 family molecular chaperone IbpA n=1 Tax=Peribacillus deserti TaxID=673318 RepID=A0ABS2QH68_9BACI|nr:Hsp20/alpha crystallin family protein [Peribacillus deserti]MBM7692510.1 HSP20 family molecular chaperone IbpA [Peribacillus deserti]